MSMEFLKAFLAVAVAWLSYLAARWMLDISSPEQDYREMLTWPIFNISPKWYRGMEFWHQVRAWKLLQYE